MTPAPPRCGCGTSSQADLGAAIREAAAAARAELGGDDRPADIAIVFASGNYGTTIRPAFESLADIIPAITLIGATAEGVLRLPAAALHLAYRHAALPPRAVVVRARLRTQPGDASPRMAEIRAAREATQPIRARTGGSTFRNPEGQKAWALIDAAGCRGMRLGAAQVSEKHCNFLLNLGGATAADIEGLGEAVRARVRAHCGVDLHWEIARLGVAA